MGLAELAGADAEHGGEGAGEGLVSFVACIECQAYDLLVGELEAMGGAFEPETADVLLDGFADHAAKDAVKVKGGESGDGGEIVEGELVVEVHLNVHEDAEDALGVVAGGLGFLWIAHA